MSMYRIITRRWLPIVAIGILLPCFDLQAQPDGDDQSHFDDEHDVDAYRSAIEEGTQRFEHGDFRGARRAFQRAYGMYPRAEVMFNIASTYRREGDAPRALEAYEQVLTASDVDPQRRALSERACDELRAEIEEMDAKGQPEAAVPAQAEVQKAPHIDTPPPTAKAIRSKPGSEKLSWSSQPDVDEPAFPWYRDPLGATFVGVGVVSFVAGSYLMLDAQSLATQASQAGSHGAFVEELNDARDSRRLGGVLAAAGGVAALYGGYRILAAEPNASQVSVVSDGQGVKIGYAGHF